MSSGVSSFSAVAAGLLNGIEDSCCGGDEAISPSCVTEASEPGGCFRRLLFRFPAAIITIASELDLAISDPNATWDVEPKLGVVKALPCIKRQHKDTNKARAEFIPVIGRQEIVESGDYITDLQVDRRKGNC